MSPGLAFLLGLLAFVLVAATIKWRKGKR